MTGEKLFDLFTRTREVRRSIIEAGQEIDAPDFSAAMSPRNSRFRPASGRCTVALPPPGERTKLRSVAQIYQAIT